MARNALVGIGGILYIMIFALVAAALLFIAADPGGRMQAGSAEGAAEAASPKATATTT